MTASAFPIDPACTNRTSSAHALIQLSTAQRDLCPAMRNVKATDNWISGYRNRL